MAKSFLDPPIDCSGHGTQVASIIGGTNTGVAKLVTLHSVKVLDCNGEGRNQDLLAAINWIVENHKKPAIVNMSVGGPKSFSIDRAIEWAFQEGLLVISAAGNQSMNSCDFSPSGSKATVNVGSYDENDKIAKFSNWGRCVDVFAPGTNVTGAASIYASAKVYAISSGTSMSAPIVTGIAAQFLEFNSQLKPNEIREFLLKNTATDILKQDILNGSPNKSIQIPSNIGATAVKIRFFKIDYSANWRNTSTLVWMWVTFGIILILLLAIIVWIALAIIRRR